MTAQDHIGRRSTNVLLIDASVLMVHAVQSLFHLRTQKQNESCISVTGIWCIQHCLILCSFGTQTSCVMSWGSYLCRAVMAIVLSAPVSDSANRVSSGMASGRRAFFRASRYIWTWASSWVLSGPARIRCFTSTTAWIPKREVNKLSASLKWLWLKWIKPQNYRWIGPQWSYSDLILDLVLFDLVQFIQSDSWVWFTSICLSFINLLHLILFSLIHLELIRYDSILMLIVTTHR